MAMTEKKRPALVATLAAAGLVLFGCPRRLDFGPRGEIEDPAALLSLVAEAEAQVVTVTGEARVRVDTPENRGAFSMFVAVSRPALLHLEPLDFFGRPQAVLVVQGDAFGLYQLQDNRYYRGPATPQNVSRFLPLALPAPELAQVMLGAAPRIPYERLELSVDTDCACYRLTLHQGAVRQELEVQPSRYRVLRSRIIGADAYNLEFSDFTTRDGAALPRRIVLGAPAVNVKVDLRYTDVTVNEAPDLTLFELEPVEGAEIVEVDERGAPQEGAPPPKGPDLAPPAEGAGG
jgi:hypothetical protein